MSKVLSTQGSRVSRARREAWVTAMEIGDTGELGGNSTLHEPSPIQHALSRGDAARAVIRSANRR
ncbi:hypothetical protein [Streptomyces sp. NPDC001820]|uniref:hypothetical protein n=1 Tax=Streptomyces sp. NPDC001820 TaxID=3364613 RepID=UPI0036CEE226